MGHGRRSQMTFFKKSFRLIPCRSTCSIGHIGTPVLFHRLSLSRSPGRWIYFARQTDVDGPVFFARVITNPFGFSSDVVCDVIWSVIFSISPSPDLDKTSIPMLWLDWVTFVCVCGSIELPLVVLDRGRSSWLAVHVSQRWSFTLKFFVVRVSVFH